MTPGELIDRFSGLKALVIGEAMLDCYLTGHVGRVCREAPVPIVALHDRHEAPGGAANTAVAVAALGVQCRFLSVVGQDEAGDRLRNALCDNGVDVSNVLRAPGRATMVKERVSAHGQLLLRVDRGTEDRLDELHDRRLTDAIAAFWDKADAVIISDYGYGICSPAVIAAIERHQRRNPRVLVADAKDLARWANAGLIAAKPNYEEAVRLIGASPIDGPGRVGQIGAARQALQDKVRADILTVTLDRLGALVFDADHEPYRTFTTPAADSHAAGAGDTFTATLALALAAGASAPQAADLAASAATGVVAQAGTTTCRADALRELIAGNIVGDGCPVAVQIDGWRRAGKRIVFTNGCFDILHHGHISYLNRAKAMGDILVVGLNSDASVRALKGPQRPINGEDDRAAVLAALSSVDLVLLFDDPAPSALIENVRPHLFVKGGDYTYESLPEAALVESLGGEVKILPFLDNRSTTGIIARIRQAYKLEATA